ncbi:MAG TPA: hypothetical protein VMN78_06465 [Longimicrobiales bacterium]|nr:hypothetical protein [Longimicrobiales bacterium]
MRKATAVLATSLLLVAAACSRNVEEASDPAPAAATEFDPSGMYDFLAEVGIVARTGTLEIERAPTTGFRGEAWLEGEGQPAIIESGTVTDRHVVLNATVGGGTRLKFELDFAGAGFSGVVSAGGDTIAVTGTRRPS